MMSIGLLWLQCGGSTLLSSSVVDVEISASSPPSVSSASVAITPGPPALVTIASLGPLGRGWLASTSRHIENIGYAINSQNADAPEGRLQHIVASRPSIRYAMPRLWQPAPSARP